MGGRSKEKKIGCGSVEGEKDGVFDIGKMVFFSKAEIPAISVVVVKTPNDFLAMSLEYIVR